MRQALSMPGTCRLDQNLRSTNYAEKIVEFLYDSNGQLLLLTGRFVMRRTGDGTAFRIHYTGRLAPTDPPLTDYIFRLSQAHVRSMRSAVRSTAHVDFLMEKPLQCHDCVASFDNSEINHTPLAD